MSFLDGLAARTGIVSELLGFFWANKWWWMTPMIVMLMLIAGPDRLRPISRPSRPSSTRCSDDTVVDAGVLAVVAAHCMDGGDLLPFLGSHVDAQTRRGRPGFLRRRRPTWQSMPCSRFCGTKL